MRLHHLATSFLVFILPSTPRAAASDSDTGLVRLSASKSLLRPGRLLSSSSLQDDHGFSESSHHGPMHVKLLNTMELIDAASIELSLPSYPDQGAEEDFDNEVTYTYDLDWRDEVGGGWHGRLRQVGAEDTAATTATAHFFAAPPSKGLQKNRLAGMVHRGDGTMLRITTKPDGTHWFEVWDDGSISSTSRNEEAEGTSVLDENDDGVGRRRDQEVADFGDDDGTTIDHLSVYTRRAMCEHALVGFYPCPPTPYIRAPIEEFIALQVSVTNYVLANTHVPTRLNSVHVFMDPDYDQEKYAVPIADSDPNRSEIGVALSHLKTVGSGHFEEARRRQNMYCADIVTLFATIGLGLAGGPYNVVNHGSGGWGFAHEIGHSINAGHRNDDPNKTGYKYGYGYGPDDSDPSYYATIMAFGGKKVPMYSTPDYTWEGKIVGTATENNRQSIIDNLIKSANWRRSEQCNPSCEYGSDGSPLGCPSSCSKCHFPSDFCYDDPLFFYEEDIKQSCEWVRSNQGQCDNTVSKVDGRKIKIQDHCPVSCDACPVPPPTDPPTPTICEDDPTFLKNSVDGRGCDWVAKSVASRCADNAGDGYMEGEKIYDYCRLTCNMCHLDDTPPPSPSPCADIPGNHFQDNTEGCDWIGEKLEVRCEKYSKAETHCPETCGLCNAPTSSPTARGACADDDDWVYQAPKDKYSFLTCAWVRDDPEDRCQHSRMKHHCPVTCETCCEDEPDWHYGINQANGGNPDKDCAYYAENGCNNAAESHCPRTCGLCPNYLANAGGPFPDRRTRQLRVVDEHI